MWLLYNWISFIAFSALTLLVGWQKGHPVCKGFCILQKGFSFCKTNTVSFNFSSNFINFSALTLLVGGRKDIWPVKNWVVGCWHGYLSGVRCRLAYGPADATATHCLLLQWSRLVLPFWYRLTQVVPDRGPLNGCVCVLYKWTVTVCLALTNWHC